MYSLSSKTDLAPEGRPNQEANVSVHFCSADGLMKASITSGGLRRSRVPSLAQLLRDLGLLELLHVL